MRLLKRSSNGALSLTEDLTDDDVQNRYRYAILSHRWEANEVTFEDMANGTSKSKEGYGKLQFCADQATRDSLEYFWVDTCCINKSNNVELHARFEDYRKKREVFNEKFKYHATKRQKYYVRGEDSLGNKYPENHRTDWKVKPFASKVDPGLQGELDKIKAGIIDGSITVDSPSSLNK